MKHLPELDWLHHNSISCSRESYGPRVSLAPTMALMCRVGMGQGYEDMLRGGSMADAAKQAWNGSSRIFFQNVPRVSRRKMHHNAAISRVLCVRHRHLHHLQFALIV